VINLSVNLTDKDSGWDKFAQELDALKGKKVVVGIQSNEDTELLKYANANEFGTEIIPPRPFIRQTFEKELETLKETGFKLGEQVMFGKLSHKSALELWGGKFISLIRSEVAEGNNFEPNAPLTIRKKGAGKHPLQDSGRLMQALKAVVE